VSGLDAMSSKSGSRDANGPLSGRRGCISRGT
jgi:hypothetical protein